MTLLDRYMAEIRARITEVQELLDQADIPEDKAQAIRENLSMMLEIVAQYE